MRAILQALYISITAALTTNKPLNVTETEDGFIVSLGNVTVLNHSMSSPAVFVGTGQTSFREYRGNFVISDYLEERVGLTTSNLTAAPDGKYVVYFSYAAVWVKMKIESDGVHPLVLSIQDGSENYDRMWMRIVAEENEKVYGGGEQFSYFNLRGRQYPIWTREQGVGRNKSDIVTFYADKYDQSGGDYHTTYFPQLTLVSSRRYYLHHTGTDYAILDLQHPTFHELFFLGSPGRLCFYAGNDFKDLVSRLTAFLGRQPELPDWIYDGAILGVQGGTQKMMEYLHKTDQHHMNVTALWIQDWSGRITTSFGQRLFWDWIWDRQRYPGLDEQIKRLKSERGIRVMAYINPSLNVNGTLFHIADTNGYLVKDSRGKSLVTDFGEFYCGTVDLTNPAAYNWYKNDVIIKNMISLGFGGWMADFGEYLPVDAILYNNRSARTVHNQFPRLWAQVNRDAIEASGNLGKIVFFTRSGGAGVGNASLLNWAGDQNVDFSYGDGLPSTIPAALSLGLSGMGLTHFDVGGYTTLASIGLVRTPERLLRSAEHAVFGPVLRTHEGNQPEVNAQFYSSPALLSQFSRISRLFSLLGNYSRRVVKETASTGVPVQRPLFMNYPNDLSSYDVTYQYMYGDDLLVSPVLVANASAWTVYLPKEPEHWVYLWNGTVYAGGQAVLVDAAIGYPPVFYRNSSLYRQVFCQMASVPFPKLHS